MDKLFVVGAGEIKNPTGIAVRRFNDFDEALYAVENEDCDEVFLCTPQTLAWINYDEIRPRMADQCDLVHCGLRLGGSEAFQTSLFTSTSWFWLNAPIERSSTNWRATPNMCWLRPDVVRVLGGFDRGYASSAARLMDLAYRLLVAGGRIRYDADWISPSTQPPEISIPLVDEFLFILRTNNRNGLGLARYAAFWSIATRISQIPTTIASLHRSVKLSRTVFAPQTDADMMPHVSRLIGKEKRRTVQPDKISVIIPTINRYEYITDSVTSILGSDPKPLEVIIVDQTPVKHRNTDIYLQYPSEQVRIILLEEAGQSVSRNAAIQAARGEWLLFFEDDAVAWESMVEKHISAIEFTGADGSTGVSLAPWKNKEDIPSHIRHRHIAAVFATGNCLVSSDAVRSINGLDRSFDHGSGADNDLGLRLYLAGYEVVFNSEAIETHFKAPSGGMRTYGAWWRNRVSGTRPFPAPTFVYTIQKYYPRFTHLAHFTQAYLSSRRYGWRYWLLLTVTLFWRFPLALHRAQCLKQRADLR